jgi:predicted AlkP superfamily phosphohydrolase/phosphomutase
LKGILPRSVLQLAWYINRRTRLRKRLPAGSVAAIGKVVRPELAWRHTKAYGHGLSGIAGININLKGREPQGIVEPGQQYEELRDEVIRELRSLKNPQTGERVMAEVYRNNEIYWGPKLNKVPDIIGIPNPRYHAVSSLYTKNVFGDWSKTRGAHFTQPNGILIAYGPDIKSGEKTEGAQLIDITPTVLHMMGLPVPQDMDGRVLNELFREDSEIARRTVKYQNVAEESGTRRRISGLKRSGKI